MSSLRTLCLTAILGGLASAASAQSPAAATPSDPTAGMTQETMPPVMDNGIYVHALLDQLEGRVGGPNPAFRWEGQAWAGTDYDKIRLKSEGWLEGHGRVEDGRHELLYDHAISSYFDLQTGIRSDLDSGTTRNWAAFGVQGLAPHFFDIEATGYLSDQGHLAARLQVSYDLLLTQRLILQPEIEANFHSKTDRGRQTGTGLPDIDAGLRLRYEISRKFAPYLGVAYEGRYGQSASFAREEGQTTQGVRFVFGIRSWF